MTKLESLLPQTEPGVRERRIRDMSSQRDSWLRQMELMQLNAMSGVTSAPARALPGIVAPPVTAPLAAAGPARVAPPVARPAPVARLPHAPQSAAQPAGHHAGDTAAAAGHSGRVRTAMLTGSFGLPPLPASTGTAGLFSAMPGEAADTAGAAMPPAAAAPQLPLRMAPLRHAAAPLPSAPPTGPVQRPPLPDAPAAAAAAALMDKYALAWPARVMHLAGTGQDLDLWIRDSALGEEAAARLVAQVAQDSASHGLRLRSVTLNGKTLAAAAWQREAFGATPYFNIIQPKDHDGTR